MQLRGQVARNAETCPAPLSRALAGMVAASPNRKWIVKKLARALTVSSFRSGDDAPCNKCRALAPEPQLHFRIPLKERGQSFRRKAASCTVKMQFSTLNETIGKPISPPFRGPSIPLTRPGDRPRVQATQRLSRSQVRSMYQSTLNSFDGRRREGLSAGPSRRRCGSVKGIGRNLDSRVGGSIAR